MEVLLYIILIVYYTISTIIGLLFIIYNWDYLYTFDLFPSDFREGRKEAYRMTRFGSIAICCIYFIICPIIYIGCFIHYIFYGSL